jgi:dTMP kinase
MIGCEPDLTFIIDMDPEVALKRGLARNSGEDRFEDFGLPFQETLRHGFLSLAKAFPERCVLIDGNRSTEEIATEIAVQYAART